MTIELELGGRSLAATAVEALCDWAPRNGPVISVHAGDVGWHLRHDDADLADTVIVARDGSAAVAVALVESDALRATVRPDHADDAGLAAALGELAQSRANRGFYCDAPQHLALHAWLAAAGWTLDPEPWTVLYRPLTVADGDLGAGLALAVDTDEDIRDRVAVQFAAFKRSTFTVERWHQMATGPGYRRELDLLRRDDDATSVAAATAWTAGAGRVGILEPVGTHRDHLGHGHGKAATLAAIGALARVGASGVAVQTPSSNTAAVRTYERCGLHPIARIHAVRYPSPHS